jgi:signal peptidase
MVGVSERCALSDPVKLLLALTMKLQAMHFMTTAVLIMLSPLMLWKGLAIVACCETPVEIMLSSGAEPWNRGDVLVLAGKCWGQLHAGDNVAFRVKGRNIPIVHRVIEVHDDPLFLTKGDVNPVDDRGLYPKGQR